MTPCPIREVLAITAKKFFAPVESQLCRLRLSPGAEHPFSIHARKKLIELGVHYDDLPADRFIVLSILDFASVMETH